jgi:hypothetical protein
MKTLSLLALLALSAVPAPAEAYHQEHRRTCYERQVVRTWVPGNSRWQGHYRPEYRTVEVPCSPPAHSDLQTCRPTRGIIGGILGGAAGAGLSRGDGRAWAVPLGVGLGAIAGCVTD